METPTQLETPDAPPRSTITWRECVLGIVIVVAGFGWLFEAMNIPEHVASPSKSKFMANYNPEGAWLAAMDAASVETAIVSSVEDAVDLPNSYWRSRRFVIEHSGATDDDMGSAFQQELIDVLEVEFGDEWAQVHSGGFRFSAPWLGRVRGVTAQRPASIVQIFFHVVPQSENAPP